MYDIFEEVEIIKCQQYSNANQFEYGYKMFVYERNNHF